MKNFQKQLAIGRYDAHVHVSPGVPASGEFAKRLKAAGLSGAVVFSEDPDPADRAANYRSSPRQAIHNVHELVSVGNAEGLSLFPFCWINPVASDALETVDYAVENGICGFKVLPGTFEPGDVRAMPVYRKIAEYDKPVVFHSGILWDGRASSQFSRPANFEALIRVSGLRFALAHISWPWCDECIAVFGKFLSARKIWGDDMADMFIDITPGTPPVYRRDALAKLFTVGYDLTDRVLFGTDGFAQEYGVRWALEWQQRDDDIYAQIGLSSTDVDSVYRKALASFLFGGSTDRRIPEPGA